MMKQQQEQRQWALAEVRAVYAELARRPVQRDCRQRTECCQFAVTGRAPQLTKGEALLVAKALRATGRKAWPDVEDGICPLLRRETGRCLVYADRPFGCRTHFCDEAGGPHSRKGILDLIRRLEAVDRELGGDGPRGIEASVAVTLREAR